MFKYILHATDLDEHHLHYFEQSIKIAHLLRADLFVLHVLDTPNSWQLAQNLGLVENIPLPKEDTQVLMNLLSEQYKLPTDRMLIKEGSTKHKIIECINELQIDLLVLGAPSNQFLQGELTHLSHYLIDHAPCHVMVLKS